jgi:hypothetical protein
MTATYRPLFIIPEAIMRRPLTVKAKLVWGQLRFHRNRAIQAISLSAQSWA